MTKSYIRVMRHLKWTMKNLAKFMMQKRIGEHKYEMRNLSW